MHILEAQTVLAALAQSTRLHIYRALRRSPLGMAVGGIGTELGLAPNLISSHLAILAAAGLVKAERRGRTVLYRARGDIVGDVAAYLTSPSED